MQASTATREQRRQLTASRMLQMGMEGFSAAFCGNAGVRVVLFVVLVQRLSYYYLLNRPAFSRLEGYVRLFNALCCLCRRALPAKEGW